MSPTSYRAAPPRNESLRDNLNHSAIPGKGLPNQPALNAHRAHCAWDQNRDQTSPVASSRPRAVARGPLSSCIRNSIPLGWATVESGQCPMSDDTQCSRPRGGDVIRGTQRLARPMLEEWDSGNHGGLLAMGKQSRPSILPLEAP